MVRRLDAGLSMRRPGFDHRSIDARFVVEKMALGRGFVQVIPFYSQSAQYHECSITIQSPITDPMH